MKKVKRTKRIYEKPVIKAYGQIEAIVLSGKSSNSCRTDCRQIKGKEFPIYSPDHQERGAVDMIIKGNLVHTGWNQLDDDFIIYLPKEEKYFVLNSTGAEFWKLLVKGEVSLEEAVDYFLTLYDCDKEVIKKDLLELVENLEKHGLVEVK